jgi:hypothetical protein
MKEQRCCAVFYKSVVLGLILVSLGMGILLAVCLPAWILVAIEAFLLIVLGFVLTQR